MMGRIEERVDLCDGHSLLRLSHFHDFVAGAHLTLLQDAEIKPRPSAGCQQCWHLGLVHANADAIAGNARLRDLEQRAADLITVAGAHGIVEQSFDREVLAELSGDEVGPLQRSEEHTSELQSRLHLVCRLLLEKKKTHM